MPSPSRRDFLKISSASPLSLAIPNSTLALFPAKEKLKMGLISDLHLDIIHDGEQRLRFFLNEMEKHKSDFLIQMGDFAIPKPENQDFIQYFNSAHARVFHVLGNHDMDEGFSREEVVETFGMPSSYYSEDLGQIQLIVLDGNEPGGPTRQGVYDSYISPTQQAWLEGELEKAQKPILIVSHQPIAGIYPLVNAAEIQSILSRFSDKILLAVNGHAHVDQHIVLGGINYLHINSASYYWVGEKLAHQSLPPEIHENHPSLKFTCPYLEPLFAMLTIDPESGKITIEGRKSQWIGSSPFELGYSILTEKEQNDFLQPQISTRKI